MTPKYICLPSATYTYKGYSVTSLRPEDIYRIMEWRNSQKDVLRQKSLLTKKDQLQYFNSIIEPSYHQQEPDLILLSIFHKNQLIGYGGFVHIDWHSGRAEVSFLTTPIRANDPQTFSNDFRSFLHVIKDIAFRDLNIRRLTTETFDIRPEVIKILEDNSFIQEGVLRNHNCINGKFIDSILHACLKEAYLYIGENTSPPKQKNRDFNILVTSISQKVPLLEHLRKAVAQVSPHSSIIGGDSDECCLARYFVDDFWKMEVDKHLTIEEIILYCNKKDISLIIPTRDGELQFFADHVDQLHAYDIHVMISNSRAVQTCLDKILFSSFFAKNDSLNIIPSSLSIKPAFGNTLVVKERYGSGSAGTRINLNPKKAAAFAMKLLAPIFQPYIGGKEYSIDLYISKAGTPLGAVVRSRDAIINGESKITTVTDKPHLQKICLEAAKSLGLIGHVLFQVIIDKNNIPHLLECNCRIGGASTLSMQAGLHSFHWLLQESKGKSLQHDEFVCGRAGMRLVRIPKDTYRCLTSIYRSNSYDSTLYLY